MKKKAIFLDRDGTLIEDAGYPNNPDQVRIIEETVSALHALRKDGYALVVISNQSGIGRGLIQPEEAEGVHQRFLELFQREGIRFDGVYYCPHSPDTPCECRKPQPGMIRQAARELEIDLSRSYVIGDKLTDVQTGFNAGLKGILYRGHPDNEGQDIIPDFAAEDWQSTVDYILSSVHGEKKD